MDLPSAINWTVAAACLVTLAWPLNVPVMALAYKVRLAGKPTEMEPREYWTRAALASVGPAVLGLAVLALDYALVRLAGLPPGATLLVLALLYLPAAVGYVSWCWGYDEFVDGLGLFLIYVFLPGLPLLLVGWLTGLWPKVADQAPWLLK